MTDDELQKCVEFLCSQPSEAEWLEFKQSTADPYLIGENISALSNAAALHRKKRAFMLWGVEDGSRNLLGTAFRFRQTKKGKEELESWLLHMLDPRVEFHIYEGDVRGKYVVLLEIQPASHQPVAFSGVRYIRVGSCNKKLGDFPEKERLLWSLFKVAPFGLDPGLLGGLWSPWYLHPAYGLACGFVDGLGKLADVAKEYARQPRQMAIYGAEHFAEAYLCGMDIHWEADQQILDFAKRLYSPSDTPIYVGRAGPYRSCVEGMRDLFAFCSNLLYAHGLRRCPLEPDLLALARSHAGAERNVDYRLRYEQARIELWKEQGIRTWDDARKLLADDWIKYANIFPEAPLCTLAERFQFKEFAIKLEREGLAVARVFEGGK